MRTAAAVFVVAFVSGCNVMPTETTANDSAVDARADTQAIVIEQDATPERAAEASSDSNVADAGTADSEAGSPYAVTDPDGITYVPPCNPGLAAQSDVADKYCYEAFYPRSDHVYARDSAHCSIGQADVSWHTAYSYLPTLHTKCQAAVSYNVSPPNYVCWSATESIHPCVWNVD